jgi:hypothetical protein
MREIRSYGSVRGVVGDRDPYRDPSTEFAPVQAGPLGEAIRNSLEIGSVRPNLPLAGAQPQIGFVPAAEFHAGSGASTLRYTFI